MNFRVLFRVLISLGLLAPALGPVPATAADIPSTITQVTVFSDRALVERTAEVTLAAGEQTVSFGELTGSMDPETIQIKGTGAAMIKGVKVEPVYKADNEDEDLVLLTQKLDDVTNRMTMVADQIEHARQEKQFIEAIAKRLTTASEKSEQAELDPKKWIDMVDFYRAKLDSLDKELRVNTAALKPLQDKKTKLERDLNDLRSRIQYTRYAVFVILTAKTEGPATLTLSYIVHGPYWMPRYDIRADSKNSSVQVAYHALVKQNTGENWNRVRLVLSTAQPQAGDKHPALFPWRVRPYTPPIPTQKTMKKKRIYKAEARPEPMAAGGAERDMVAAQPAMTLVAAQAQTGGTAVNFEIQGRHTVKSDNQSHQVSIMVQDFPAKFQYSTVPKLAAHAYLKAEITNDTDFPLLDGQTNIFLDNNFVANGTIETVSPSETFSAFLGIDEGIKVEYKLINREQSKPGMFGGKIKVVFDYAIKVTNHKKLAQDIIIQDQLPLSENRDIQVELISPAYRSNDPSFTKNNENLLEWKTTLQPGKTFEIPLKFSVVYPETMQIEGL